MSPNTIRILHALALHGPKAPVTLVALLPGMSVGTLRATLQRAVSDGYALVVATGERAYKLTTKGAMFLELALIDDGRMADALHLSRRRFEARYSRCGVRVERVADGDYLAQEQRIGWASWCAALGLS